MRAVPLLAFVAALFFALGAQAQPAALQGLKLVDQQRQPLTAATVQRQVVLLHFVFTTCSSTCPLQVRDLAEVHAALPDDVRRQLRFVSVSVDPLQDTPASLAAFAKRLGADRPGWHFVTGAPAQVEQLIDRMQVMDARKPNPKPEDHRTSLYLFNAAGTLVQRYGGVPVDRPRLVAEITQVARLPAAAVATAATPRH